MSFFGDSSLQCTGLRLLVGVAYPPSFSHLLLRRCPFRDEYEKFTVTASNGEVAWSAGNFDLLLAKLFRELALVASSKGEEALVVAILDHVLKDQSSELYEMFTGLLRPEGGEYNVAEASMESID